MTYAFLHKFAFHLREAVSGAKIYRKLKKRYPDFVICINQHEALGDAYLMSLYLPAYFKEKKYIVTTVGKASYDVFKYMGIADVEILSKAQTEQLIEYAMVCGIEESAVKILHHQAIKWHIGIAWQLQGANGLNFADMIEGVVFKGLTKKDRRYPSKVSLDDTFSQKGMVKGGSVIFFPYANTLAPPPTEYWEEYISKKARDGLRLFTHIYGEGAPLPGTEKIELKLCELAAAAEYAGEIICARSGLADILSAAKCKKTVVYPKGGAEGWIHGELLDFWSVNGFGYCDDAVELTYKV